VAAAGGKFISCRKKRQDSGRRLCLRFRLSMPSRADLLRLLRHLRGGLDGDVSLNALAERSGWSSFHLHRAFRRMVGETPKAYTQRLRLDRAAARLAAGTDRVVDVALDSGFASHEVFTRAFTRRFGRTPSATAPRRAPRRPRRPAHATPRSPRPPARASRSITSRSIRLR